jgi:hypothetical protein
MTDPITGKPTGAISRTYLDRHQRKIGKAKSLGEGGGIIRLSPDEEVLHGLTLAEGLETGLAALSIGLRPVWSTGSNTNMAKFPLLAGVEALTILADHDASGAGERAAREVELRWRQAGREVRIFMWEKVGDINDALRHGSAMSLSPEERLILLGMRETRRLQLSSEAPPANEGKDSFAPHLPELSASYFGQPLEAISDEGCPVEDLAQKDKRAKLPSRRRHDSGKTTQQQRPLIFVDPPTLAAALHGRLGGPKQWVGLCPCHPDHNTSLSIRWERNGGTVIKCHAACKQEDVLEKVRQLGFRLDREPQPKMNRTRPSVSVSTAVAIAACNLSERRMFDVLRSERAINPDGALFVTYNQFCERGVRRSSIPGGLRAMEALGLITVQRAPFSGRRQRYEMNQYWLAEGWQLFEPKAASPQARKAMLAKAREVAGGARKSEA